MDIVCFVKWLNHYLQVFNIYKRVQTENKTVNNKSNQRVTSIGFLWSNLPNQNKNNEKMSHFHIPDLYCWWWCKEALLTPVHTTPHRRHTRQIERCKGSALSFVSPLVPVNVTQKKCHFRFKITCILLWSESNRVFNL